MLPLILGIIGIVFMYNHSSQGRRDLWTTFLLFFMTGLAIVIYLNQSPLQPRERDYAFAGSFYVFTIWIGIGVLAVYKFLKKFLPDHIGAGVAAGLSLLLVPVVMGAQNWDDHDRSGRYTCRDFGANYLKTCQPNSIIFTNGDNDTFPLWYNQEVEGVRTDTRVCNLSYLQTDWYIDQMKSKAYDSDPLPISFNHDQYVQGKSDVVYLVEDPRVKSSVELKKALEFIKDDNPRTKLEQADNASYIPSKKLFFVVDKEAVIKNKVVEPKDYDKIVDTIQIDLGNKQYLTKDELMILDMIATNNWKRPIYFAITIGKDKYMNLQDYFQHEGFAYRFVPIKSNPDNTGLNFGAVNTRLMYDNLMNNFKWGNMNDPKVYIDENNSRMMMNIRNTFDRLAEACVNEGQNDKAEKVIDRCVELIPDKIVPFSYFAMMMGETAMMMGETYFKAGKIDKGKQMLTTIMDNFKEKLDFYYKLNRPMRNSVDEEIQRSLYFMREINLICSKYDQKELLKDFSETFNHYLDKYSSFN